MSFPNFPFWSRVLATVGVEVCGLAALGLVAQRCVRSAVWQRAVWQITVVCLLLLPASEWTGVGRGAAGFLFGQKRVVENVPASGFPVFQSPAAVGPWAANLKSPPAVARPSVWWPGWVWLGGAVIVLGRMAAAQVLLLALRRRRVKIVTQSLRERVACVARSVGLRRKVSLLRMPESISPMAFGILRSSIGLPPGFEAKLSATEQEAVLAHELAHLAAMDPLWFLLADCASAWLWWHPLAWWVRRSLHGAAELAADDATAMVPDGPGALANCLVSLGKEMTAARGWSWIGINGGFRSKLGRRVERLTRMSGGPRRPLGGWTGAAAKLAATILIVPAIVLLCGSFQSAHAQKEDSWRGQLRRSWISSPGARLLLAASDDRGRQTTGIAAWVEKARMLYEKDKLLMPAALDDKAKLKLDIATWVQNGKLLYEMGKYDDAVAVLQAVIREDQANRSAAYYLDLVKEARNMDSARRGAEGLKSAIGNVESPNPMWNTNLVYTAKGRQHILSKLESIIIDEVSYDLPLKDVLQKLRAETQKRDPDGIGVNFIINQNVESPSPFSADITGAAPPAAAAQQKDIGTDVRIRIDHPLTNLRLADVLDAITKVADSPIRYTVEDYAVVFSPKPPEAIPGLDLYTRIFHVDPNAFMQSIEDVTANPVRVTLTFLQSFENDTAVISNLVPHIISGYVTRTNRTVEDDRLVAAYFAALGINLAPPKAIFFNDRLGELLVRATLGDLELVQRAIEALNQTPPQVMIEARFTEMDEAFLQLLAPDWKKPAQEFTSIMTDKQFRSALAAIEQHTRADVLSVPKVTTESGRQAHLDSSNGNGGVTLDVLPFVKPDGYFIQIKALSSVKTGQKTWQAEASRQVFDGETMVIGGVMTDLPSGAKKFYVVFVTPRIIDPAGNPVHTDDELSRRPGLPGQ